MSVGNRGAEPSIAVVGSGFSGIGLAIGLREAGFTAFTVFEKAEGVGGVWRDNTYPGAACDAPSHLYSYSFEPKPDWSRRFAEQPEILDYLRHCAVKSGILPHIRFGTEVVQAEYLPGSGRWSLHTADGERHEFDMLVAACGQLSNPAVPSLPGRDAFTGTAFHSARWDHDHDLRGERIAVVGNGASAVQFVPLIARDAAELTIFQIETHWISRKPDRVYPRWRHALNRRVPLAQKLSRLGVFLWFELLLNPALIAPRGRALLSAHIRAMCRFALRSVRDRGLRDRLRPRYEPGCKRILTSSEYYATLNRPNVRVVDSPDHRDDAGRAPHRGRRAPPRRHRHLGHRLPLPGLRRAHARRRPARPGAERGLEGRRARLPRHGRHRLPQLLPHVRAQHERGLRLHRPHARKPGRATSSRRPGCWRTA